MPISPLKPCAHPLCPKLVPCGTRRCEEHQTEKSTTYEQAVRKEKGSAWARGYDADWYKVREVALKRDNYLCQECLKVHDRIVPAEHVDHIIPFKGKDDPRRLDLTNLQSLCKPCHSKKTVEQDGAFGNKKLTVASVTNKSSKKQWWQRKENNGRSAS